MGLSAGLLEEVSYEALVLQSCSLVTVDFRDFFPSPTRVSQKCPTRLSDRVLRECCARVSPTRVSKIVWVFVFEYVFAFGFMGSILFFF